MTPEKIRNIKEYLNHISNASHETVKVTHFISLLNALFPGAEAIPAFIDGMEKGVRINSQAGSGRRYLDAYFGNSIIEFEKDLSRTRNTAKKQLKDYAKIY